MLSLQTLLSLLVSFALLTTIALHQHSALFTSTPSLHLLDETSSGSGSGSNKSSSRSRSTSNALSVPSWSLSSLPPSRRISHSCSANDIVQEAFKLIYQPFVNSCRLEMSYEECLEMLAVNDELPPWWRNRTFAQGEDQEQWFKYHHQSHHQLWFDNPRLRFCRIEKVASTQWKHISFEYYNKPRDAKFFAKNNGMIGWTKATDDAPHVVFFRDPLERFLSAYLDKCINDETLKHCKQIRYIRKKWDLPDASNVTVMMRSKQLFDLYVQTYGLQWDVHFTPQALQCDGLFRTVHNYDFVGSMQDDRFVQDVFHLINKYPNTKLMQIVAKEFNFSPNSTNFRQEILQKKPDDEHPTGATQKLLHYFDANSVRTLLEYYSIDYVTLNLTLPKWIQEVLDRDCQRQPQGSLKQKNQQTTTNVR